MGDNEFVGSALYGTWVSASGTVTFSTDSRNFNYRPSISFVDATAGADTNIKRINSLKDGQASCTFLMQSDMGTADMNGLVEGTSGTLTWGEYGTATGKPKHSFAAISLGFSPTVPYNNVVTIDVTWQQNGAATHTTWSA